MNKADADRAAAEVGDLQQSIVEIEKTFGQDEARKDTLEVVDSFRAKLENRFGQAGPSGILSDQREKILDQIRNRALASDSNGGDLDHICGLTRQFANNLTDTVDQSRRRGLPVDIVVDRLKALINCYSEQLSSWSISRSENHCIEPGRNK